VRLIHKAADTVRDYLHKILRMVWQDGESFDGKRPFGNSSWEYELYSPLVKHGAIKGTFDEEYGDLDDFDESEANKAIFDAIDFLFLKP
jgi:hypothetical protein